MITKYPSLLNVKWLYDFHSENSEFPDCALFDLCYVIGSSCAICDLGEQCNAVWPRHARGGVDSEILRIIALFVQGPILRSGSSLRRTSFERTIRRQTPLCPPWYMRLITPRMHSKGAIKIWRLPLYNHYAQHSWSEWP